MPWIGSRDEQLLNLINALTERVLKIVGIKNENQSALMVCKSEVVHLTTYQLDIGVSA